MFDESVDPEQQVIDVADALFYARDVRAVGMDDAMIAIKPVTTSVTPHAQIPKPQTSCRCSSGRMGGRLVAAQRGQPG